MGTSFLRLIERQLETWELKRRVQDLSDRPGRCLEGAVAYGPCLLISRECGSGGRELARLTGERLGWRVFDREIVDQIANLSHARRQLTDSVDPLTRAKWEAVWEAELSPEEIGLEPYLRHLRQVVTTLGHQGDVIILGRGAQYLLPAACALRVRLVSPLELRVERVAQREKLSLEQARSRVQLFDTERAEFVRKNFRREAASPINFDLVVNTAEIPVEAAAEVVLEAMFRKLGVRAPARPARGAEGQSRSAAAPPLLAT